MNKNVFSLENISMSFAGHLAIFAVLITSFIFIAGPVENIIAQNRVQITEIDLSQVQITRDDTSLYNTAAPEPQEIPKTDFPKKPEPKPEDIGDEKTVDKPMVVPDAPKKTEKTDENSPKRTTVVRVNRETASLNRTMTISVVDALRVALTRCWVIDTKHAGLEDIRAVAHLTMYKNGAVRDIWFESAARADGDPDFSYVLDTIRDAIKACQPFKMLPESEFDYWEKIQLTFYPTQGKIL